MGGIPDQPAIKLTDEEIVSRLISIGNNIGLQKVQTVWNVENPHQYSHGLSDILYYRSATHYNYYSSNITFDIMNNLVQYKSQDFSFALKDALARLIKFGYARHFILLDVVQISK